MKKFLKYIFGAAVLGLSMTACSSEEFVGSNGVAPSVSDYKAIVDVDQEANTATFTLVDANGQRPQGVYPIWTITTSKELISTLNGYTTPKIIFEGDYKYSVKVANKNGASDGAIEGTFHIETTRYDFSKACAMLTGNASKEWRVYAAEPGHLGCGSAPGNPTEWWSAGPNDKVDNGIYDDRITFTVGSNLTTGKYNYSAGEDGLTFCNKGITMLGLPEQGQDYDVAAVGKFNTKDEAEYSLSYSTEDDAITVTLPAMTLFPYMANDSQLKGEMTYIVTDMTDKTMTWRLDFAGISWQIILINGEDEAKEELFDPENVNWAAYDSADNIGKAFNTAGKMNFWFADEGWAQIADSKFAYANGVYTVTTTNPTAAEWQGQCTIPSTDCDIKEGEFYDISFKVNFSEDVNRFSFKLCKSDDDDTTLYYTGDLSAKAGETVIRIAKQQAFKIVKVNDVVTEKNPSGFKKGKFIIDLGGTPAGVEFKLSEILVQKHNPK